LADGKIRVLLADDHAMFRQGIKEMLSTDEEIEVVGEAENGREAVALAEKLTPDVVLLDVEMPVMGAREVMERLLEDPPPPRVVIVTMYDDPRLVRELIGLGAVAYLVKSATMEELHAAVHTAANSPVGPGNEVLIVALRAGAGGVAHGRPRDEQSADRRRTAPLGSDHKTSPGQHISQDRGLVPR
jgi:DNA-binding NarL/FixJ family response regulator